MTGFGLTLMLKEICGLVQPFTEAVAEIVALAIEDVLLIVVNDAILPFPLDASPIVAFELFHEIVEPEILLLNEIAAELSPAQID